MNGLRSTINLYAVLAILAGCGRPQPPIGAPGAMPQTSAIAQPAAHGSKTFSYTGSEQYFKVPRGVTQLMVVASGASGPTASSSGCGHEGGSGGLVKATISVTPGEKLAVFVGGEGDSGSACGTSGKGGFNGGGNGGEGVSPSNGTGGGGASDVREGGDTLLNRILVAGGGGGGGENLSYGAGRGGAGAAGLVAPAEAVTGALPMVTAVEAERKAPAVTAVTAAVSPAASTSALRTAIVAVVELAVMAVPVIIVVVAAAVAADTTAAAVGAPVLKILSEVVAAVVAAVVLRTSKPVRRM
jgi:hypothetical protein